MEKKPTQAARAAFSDTFHGHKPTAIAVAPGRVNLIGEHTDYNEGFVLPMAIDANVAVAYAIRNDDVIRAYSTVFGETREAELSDLRLPGGSEWFDYVAGVAWAMSEAGLVFNGLEMAIAGDVPVGAGLASSAALEMAVARAIAHACSHSWEPVRMAHICQRAENAYVGVNCGIMDQFAASACIAGSALLLDCRSLEHTAVRIPSEARFVVMDTGARRSLAASEYNDRRHSCETAVHVFARSDPEVRSLRDVSPQALSAAREQMDEVVYKRALHVISEIQRPVQMTDALRGGDLSLAGTLMNDSHASLRDLYEVSCKELDLITDLARGHDACFGARMTGAGFGGCAVALVVAEETQKFVSDIAAKYAAAGCNDGAMYVCRPSAGATVE
jgi:galactokinase